MDKTKIINYREKERIAGEFMVTLYNEDGTSPPSIYAQNIIPDVGLKYVGDILAKVVTANTDLGFIQPGLGTTTPAIGNTDIETPLAGTPTGRQAATLQTREALSPFEVVIDLFIGSTDYTRPQTITELCIFFKSTGADNLFARGLLDSPVALTGTITATVSYGVMFR